MSDRNHWVQAVLQCLLCGRVSGRLAGSLSVAGVTFSIFRPSDAGKPPRRLRGNERFRCDVCGGNLLIDEIERFTTYHETDDAAVEHRRGRRPAPVRPITDWRLIDLGLAS